MDFTAGTSPDILRYWSHIMLQEFDIQVVCVNIEIQSACRFDGINESVYMSLGNIFFLDVCIEINTFLLIIPGAIDIQVTQ